MDTKLNTIAIATAIRMFAPEVLELFGIEPLTQEDWVRGLLHYHHVIRLIFNARPSVAHEKVQKILWLVRVEHAVDPFASKLVILDDDLPPVIAVELGSH